MVGGNFSAVQPELGQYDASYGSVLRWDGSRLTHIANKETGLKVRGDVKHISMLETSDGNRLVVFARNDKTLKAYKIKSSL